MKPVGRTEMRMNFIQFYCPGPPTFRNVIESFLEGYIFGCGQWPGN